MSATTQSAAPLRRFQIRIDKYLVSMALAGAVGWASCAAAYRIDELGWLRWRSDTLGQVQEVVAPKQSTNVVVKKTKEIAARAQAASYLGCPDPSMSPTRSQ